MKEVDYKKLKNENRRRIHLLQGEISYNLEVFGDELARRQKYRSDLDGIEAIRYYLMQKHDWLPRDVMSMSYTELDFALTEERAGWTLPKEARPATGKKPSKLET